MSKARTLAAVIAALAVTASPALAQAPEGTPDGTNNPGAGHRPEGTPNGTDNPGTAHRPSRTEARALGREQCQEFKTNFSENRSAFGKCIAAVARVLRSNVAPGRACAGQNRRRQEGQRRSDFSACVQAAARALREQQQEQPAPTA